MQPVETEGTNTKLVLPGGTEDNDLPAERVRIYPPEVDLDDAEAVATVTPQDGIDTVWVPDLGERRALANGAAIRLRIWGSSHPPVSLTISDPPEDREIVALIPKAHVDRAVGYWYAAIAKQLADTGEFPSAGEVLELWHTALEEMRQGIAPPLDDRIEEIHERLNGNGAGESCTCEPKPTGEAPDQPAADCPVHGIEAS